MLRIDLPHGLYVTDLDANQYVVQRDSVVASGKHQGEPITIPYAYCGSIKSLPDVARRVVAERASAIAYGEAMDDFTASGVAEQLLALPDKKG